MLPFNLIDAPLRFPYACVCCMKANGPLVNTHRELPGYGDVIVCKRCAKQIAGLLGFASGEKLDELENAVTIQAEHEREITSLREKVAELEAERVRLEDKLVQTEEMLGEAHGRVIQLEGRMAEEARAALNLVGDAA